MSQWFLKVYVVCEECVCGDKKAGSHPVSFPDEKHSDSRQAADILIETDCLSPGIHPPPPSTVTPHPLTSHHTQTTVTNTTDILLTATAPSLSFTRMRRYQNWGQKTFHDRELQTVFADIQERNTNGCKRTSSTRNAEFSHYRLRRTLMESWMKFCSRQHIIDNVTAFA